MRATLLFTGSPRSRCSLAMIKSTTPSSPLWRGAAQRRGGQRDQESATSLSLRVKRSNPVNYARTQMRATLLFTGSPRSQMLPRDDKLEVVPSRDDSGDFCCIRDKKRPVSGRFSGFSNLLRRQSI